MIKTFENFKKMEIKQIVGLVEVLEKYPIELILVKYLINGGINSEEELVNLLKDDKKISQPMKVKMQNYYRDIASDFYNINKIPNIF